MDTSLSWSLKATLGNSKTEILNTHVQKKKEGKAERKKMLYYVLRTEFACKNPPPPFFFLFSI